MGYSKQHVAETRRKIVEAAGRLFRQHGYDGVGIDQIMHAAGLTRGGFYAHFKSKADLFAAAMGAPFDFTNQLKRLLNIKTEKRPPSAAIFAISHYLSAETREKIGKACTMASSTGDLSRAKPDAKLGFATSFEELIDVFDALFKAQDTHYTREQIISLIATCVGSLTLARASNDEMAEQILNACFSQIQAQFDPAKVQTPID